MYGLRVSADQVPVDLARLASGDVELFEGPEQDLTGAFPKGAETIRNPERATVADMGLPHAQVNVRDLAQQIAQSGPITAETGTLLKLLLDQHEALQERVVHLEKSRSGSVISAHTAIEGIGDARIAANSSRPGGSTLAQSVVRPHVLTGGQLAGLGEIGAVSTVPSTAGFFCLVAVRSWLRPVSHNLGLLLLAVKDPYLPLKASKTLGIIQVGSAKVVVFSMVSSVRRCPGPPWFQG